MKKLPTFVYTLFAVAAAVAAPTANEDFVIAEDARTYTNAVNAAKAYTDYVVTNLPPSGVDAATVTNIVRDVAPAPGNYAAVSNAAMNALSRAEASDFAETGTVAYASGLLADNVPIDGYSLVLHLDELQDETDSLWGGIGDVYTEIDNIRVEIDNKASTNDVQLAPVYGGNGSPPTWVIIPPTTDGKTISLEWLGDGWVPYAGEDLMGDAKGGLDSTSLHWEEGREAAIELSASRIINPIIGYTLGNQADKPIASTNAVAAVRSVADAATATNAAQQAALSTHASQLSQQSQSISTLGSQVSTIGAHLNAEDARFVVTNYNSVTHTPEAYVEIKLPDESWSRIWSEMTRWNYLFDYYLPTNYYDKAAVNAALNDKADRAWGFYDSTTGAYAPDGYTWISSEKIAIAANLAYQRTITSEGAIWVLESNGTVTETGGMTNGFFRISDDEGNSLFEIVKGNKRTVGADASSCQIVAGFSPTKLQIGYSIVSDVHPTLYVCESLTTQNWKAETDSDCVANVAWSGESGAWIAQVQGKTAQSSLFVKATYEVGGETYISNAAPVSMQYMMINGVKYAVGTATISGNTVLTLTVAP